MSQRLFTDQTVIDIRESLVKGVTPRQLAATYDTTLETIRRIGRGDTYRHLGLKPIGQIELIPDDQIIGSLSKLTDLLKKENVSVAGIPPRPNPMEAGGFEDPGEGQVLA